MFDFHMHTHVSFDSTATAVEMASQAVCMGLKEICFTDHYDYESCPPYQKNPFDMADYRAAYDALSVPNLTIRRGVEFGMNTWNAPALHTLLEQYPFDFVIGSAHYINGEDPYGAEYWVGKRVDQAFRIYLEAVLDCVRAHDEFDVLGHLTYVCKSPHNPYHEPVEFSKYGDITDQIMKELVKKGKGMEINTSGIDRVGVFLPSIDFLKRFKELGGEIVTIGSDAHTPDRVGQYATEALAVLREVFGYVCTFENRQPVFHKI